MIRSLVELKLAELLCVAAFCQVTVYEVGPCPVRRGDELQPPQNCDNQPHDTLRLASIQGVRTFTSLSSLKTALTRHQKTSIYGRIVEV